MINLVSSLAKGLMDSKATHSWNERRIHASDTAVTIDGDDGKCARQFWLRYYGYDKQEVGPGRQLMFDQGHNLEEKAIEYLREGLPEGYRIVSEQMDISTGLPDGMGGRLDLLITNGTDYGIIDIKSQRGNSFRYMSDAPRPMHRLQVNTYAYALREMGIRAKYGGILVVDREGQNFAEDFWWTISDQDLNDVIETIAELYLITEYDKPEVLLPKIKINENKGRNSVVAKLPWQCRHCDYRGVSCEGAIPPEFDDKLGKVVGHIENQKFFEKVEGISEYIENYILEEG